MSNIYDLISNEMPSMVPVTVSSFWMVGIWMVSSMVALFSGLNYKEFFNRSNFDLLLLIFMFPICVLFLNFTGALLVIGVFFAGRLLLRFADKEQHMPMPLPLWLLVLVFVIGFAFTAYNVYESEVSEDAVNYSIEVQDSIMLGEMPYETITPSEDSMDPLPGPFAYYISYIPYLISPITTEFNNETHYLSNFTKGKLEKFHVPVSKDLKLVTLDQIKAESAVELSADSITFLNEDKKLQTMAAVSQKSVGKINTMGVKILQVFALVLLLVGLFTVTYKLASIKLAFFMMILVLFLPWKTVLLGSTWHVLAIGVFLFAVLYIKRMWLSGILLGIAVGINPILIVTLPLFINYYMPNIAKKGYWLISLGIMIFGIVMVLFAPHFETEAFNFMPMRILGAIIIFIGILLSLTFSFLGNPLKRAPGSFFFAFLILLLISFFVVIMNSHESSITNAVEIFSKSVLASSFITGAGVLKTIAIPLFGLLILFNFLPRNIAQGGLIVLSAVLMLFTIFVLEIPMNGSEFLLLLPALFISHLKGAMLAEDKLTSIRLKESIDNKALGKPKNNEVNRNFKDAKPYGISEFAKGDKLDDSDDDIHVFGDNAFELDDNGEIVSHFNDDDIDFFSKDIEKGNIEETNTLIDRLSKRKEKEKTGRVGDMVQDVLDQRKKEEEDEEDDGFGDPFK